MVLQLSVLVRISLLALIGMMISIMFSAMAVHANEAQKKTIMGGAEMAPTKTIFENTARSANHTFFTHAILKAGLHDTLTEAGPFTIFAPTNTAFSKLPKDYKAAILLPENKTMLQNLVSYHVVMGRFNRSDLENMMAESQGKLSLQTVQGSMLIIEEDDKGRLKLTDEHGEVAHITMSDVQHSNGTLFVTDNVMRPKLKLAF
jgi:uncharacterized surface protein with fasciclin (FAS1) repeats